VQLVVQVITVTVLARMIVLLAVHEHAVTQHISCVIIVVPLVHQDVLTDVNLLVYPVVLKDVPVYVIRTVVHHHVVNHVPIRIVQDHVVLTVQVVLVMVVVL